MQKVFKRLFFFGVISVMLNSSGAFAYYNPELGRFMSRDPISDVAVVRIGISGPAKLGKFIQRDPIEIEFTDGSNLYAAYFVPGNVDPLGLAEETPYDENSVAYGEIREWAVKKSTRPVDYSAPEGLGDAKASLWGICSRNKTCKATDGSKAAADADKAAWKNIQASKGEDKSGKAWFVCVGHEGCWFVGKCYKCACEEEGGKKVWKVKLIERDKKLEASSKVEVKSEQGGALFFYEDSFKGWCDAESYKLGKKGCEEKNQ
ncbi:MAG: hypothetical protein V1809_02415 [Planctomycetota bacterium]